MNKSHIELNGWEIRRVRGGWFHLWIAGGIFPASSGQITHVNASLRKYLGIGDG